MLRCPILCLSLLLTPSLALAERPNILLIYADDLGFGDVSCYGATTIATPNIDRLAAEGLRFTDGHAAAATCTPSRFALLTGQYAFRQSGTGILPGDARLIIEPGRATLPAILKRAGYRTGVVGKWHLGLGAGEVDWNGEIKPGPMEVGFDESFIMAATGDRVPCVYVRGHQVVGLDANDPIQINYKTPFPGLPTGRANPELLRMKPSHGHDFAIVNGISRIGYMKGGTSALWKDEDMADVFKDEAVAFLERNRAGPFFLYFATHDPHVPRVPHPRYAGKSGMGPRGDAIVQFDDNVGTVMKRLGDLGLRENTLVILTSDNGPVVDDGYQDEAVEKLGAHKPGGPWRGGKYSAFEAGTRVPFIVRWPAKIAPGVSAALVSQVDLPASLASLTGQKLATGEGPDSEDVMPALLGKDAKGRGELVEQAGVLALRQGTWKYIESGRGPKVNANTNTELGNDPEGQLYDLADDPGETRNLIKDQPAQAQAMAARLKEIKGVLPEAGSQKARATAK
jgi:arylsulfatase A-like enzyme